ncbi:MAG: hypothetical protein M1376_08250 [Planctomycetes bacterium]|nr:hypothetical protein [Planctomycetota bacterium]
MWTRFGVVCLTRIAELPHGDLLVAWLQGSRKRWADDMRIMGARLKYRISEDYDRQ